MSDLDNAAFLDLLEQHLGQRWPKEWRRRFWNIEPKARWMLKGARNSIRADIQRASIDNLRKYLSDQAIARLTK